MAGANPSRNEKEAKAVSEIFNQYINGASLKAIADYLNKTNIVYHETNPVWNKGMVNRILENKKYIGENGYPSIVSECDFKKVKDVAINRKQFKPTTEFASALKNKLFCSECGNRYTYNENASQITATTDYAENGTVEKVTRNIYGPNNSYVKTYNDANNNNTLDSAEEYVQYNYNTGRMNSIETAKSKYTIAYDAVGNKASVGYGKTTFTPLMEYNYANNGFGKLESVEYGNGAGISYTYDSDGRMISQTNTNGAVTHTYTWTYDASGNVTKVTDSENGLTKNYYYDLSNQLVNVTNSLGQQVKLTVDSKDKITSKSYIWGNTTKTYGYFYDTAEELDYLTLTSGLNYTTESDALSRLTSTKINTTNPIEKTFEYLVGAGTNQTNLVSKMTQKNGSTSTDGTIYSYTYDDDGNILTVSEQVNATATPVLKYQYFYDELGQLIQENCADISKSFTYSYDNSGNITQRTVRSFINGVLGTVVIPYNYTYGNSEWGDLLTNYNGFDFTYDETGNPLSYYGMTFTWKDGRRLATASNLTYNIEYKYDIDGLRLSKLLTSKSTGVMTYVEYFYQGSLLTAQKTTNNYETANAAVQEIWFLYDVAGSLLGFTYCDSDASTTYDGTYYYILNLQGDIEGIANSDGIVVVSYKYFGSYGKISSVTGTLASTIGALNPVRYKGYCYESETGLYYVGSRYYDSNICRWLSADTTDIFDVNQNSHIQYNIYSYCLNNPVNMVDPDGEIAFLATIAIGFAVGAIVGGVTAAIQGKSAKGIMLSALGGGVAGAISTIPIPGLGAFGSSIIMGGVGNLTNNFIRGSVKNFKDVLSSLLCGAAAGALGYYAGSKLTGIANKYWNNLTRVAQKRAITGLGKVNQRYVNIVLKQIKSGVTDNIYNQLVKRYGLDVVLSATVSAIGTEVKGK